LLFAVGIHREEEAFMFVSHEFPLPCQPFKGLMLEGTVVTSKIVEHFPVEHEESRAGDPLGTRLFKETHDTVLIRLQDAESGTGRDRSDCSQLSVTLVELYQPGDVYVGNAIAVSQKERVVIDVLLDPFHAPTGHCGQAGVSQGDLEILLAVYVVELDLRLAPEADGEVVVHCLVVQEVFFDHVATISQAQDKLAEATVGIELHDVPEDGSTANFDHRFRPEFSFLAQAGTESSAQHNYFHEILLADASASFPGQDSGQTAPRIIHLVCIRTAKTTARRGFAACSFDFIQLRL